MQEPGTRSMWQTDRADGHARAASMMRGQVSTDVLVVGGGIAGVTAALLLKRGGKDVVLIEARHIGSGDTGGERAISVA